MAYKLNLFLINNSAAEQANLYSIPWSNNVFAADGHSDKIINKGMKWRTISVNGNSGYKTSIKHFVKIPSLHGRLKNDKDYSAATNAAPVLNTYHHV